MMEAAFIANWAIPDGDMLWIQDSCDHRAATTVLKKAWHVDVNVKALQLAFHNLVTERRSGDAQTCLLLLCGDFVIPGILGLHS